MKTILCLIVAAAVLGRSASMGQTPPTPAQPAVAVPPAIPPKPTQLSDYLAFDSMQKDYVATNGESTAHVKFTLTNISQETVTIDSVKTSCHCTTAHLPPMPWKLDAGTNGEINVSVDLAGKSAGVFFKTVTVNADKGTERLLVKVTVLAAGGAGTAGTAPTMGSREMNRQLAEQNRQAVFSGDCAQCHVAKGVGKTGQELYAADCGICHEAEHRATAVPDLRHLNHENSRELWDIWIRYGKAGSMMPAFAQSEGGPLSDEQIRSLVSYLAETIPPPAAAPAK